MIDEKSLTSLPIKTFSETEVLLATYTAFIYEYDSAYYLITNWHNLTGKNCDTLEPINNNLTIPTKIEVPFPLKSQSKITWKHSIFDILDLDNGMSPRWFIHPRYGFSVDVIALKIDIPPNISSVYPINKIDFDDFNLVISDEIFILGFPYRNLGGHGQLPIWKKGSVATEPGANIDGKPKILVDTASRPGMSGSPVIFKRYGYHARSSTLSSDDIFGTITGFVGVYSGRLPSKDTFDAQLGIVWKKEVIEEIIVGKKLDEIR